MTAEATPAEVKVPKRAYERELLRLQQELVEVQEWVRATRVAATMTDWSARASGSKPVRTR